MTIRKTLQDLLRRDSTAEPCGMLNFDEFDALNWLLLLRAREMRKKPYSAICWLATRQINPAMFYCSLSETQFSP